MSGAGRDAAGRPVATEARLRGLHVLADDAPHWKHDPVEQARAACRGGASVVQLRAKRATDRETLAWAAGLNRCLQKWTLTGKSIFPGL